MLKIVGHFKRFEHQILFSQTNSLSAPFYGNKQVICEKQKARKTLARGKHEASWFYNKTAKGNRRQT